jgi:class 3 adenylate cyclase
MPKLDAGKRARLPDSAFAYIDSRGRRRLPINDEVHVRNALARFNQVAFESDQARERARLRLLRAARKYGIVPVGFITGQLQSERNVGEQRAREDDAARLPTGQMTLLMTDIEGSTGLLHFLGDGYGEVLDQVREAIRAAISSEQGFEVDARADEFFAVFEAAPAALRAALAIHRGLVTLSSGQARRIKVRIGIHTGHPSRRGASYVGVPVHTTARLCAVARGGQVVVSAETRQSVRGNGFRFRNLGTRRLAGIPEEVAIFILRQPYRHDDLSG